MKERLECGGVVGKRWKKNRKDFISPVTYKKKKLFGTNVLVGEDAEKLGEEVHRMVSGEWKPSGIPDRWDGRTADRILQILCTQLPELKKGSYKGVKG